MKKLLLPISWIYSVVLFIRHKLYDWNILHSEGCDKSSICVGNLSLGGTGKTPHIEYLIEHLSPTKRLSVLSRGYGRKSKGLVIAKEGMTYKDIGDEPFQYFTKYNNITVAVDENRVEGCKYLINNTDTEVILLDDAYQHRKIIPGLNILLTEFYNIYPKDYLLPAGKLRDIRYAAKRADIIVITKSPKVLSPFIQKDIFNKIKPLPHQKILYSYIDFLSFKPLNSAAASIALQNIKSVLLFCGIANPVPLEEYIKENYNTLSTIYFKDHHDFSESDIDNIITNYNDMIGKNKIIITTEKDAMRLIKSSYLCKFEKTPLFTIPIKVSFHKNDKQVFDNEILSYVRRNT